MHKPASGHCGPPLGPEVCWLGLEAPQSVGELLPDWLIWDPLSAEPEVNVIPGEKFTRVTQMTPVLFTGFSVLREAS